MFWNSLENAERFKNDVITSVCNWYTKHKAAFWAAYIVTLVAYSYFFTQLGFSNHTFPQVWTYSYPSYRTTQEGRWFQDLMIWLLGGVGVSSTQMYVAAALQIINTIVFAEMVGVEGRFQIFLASALLSVYPAFCDRYIFPGSQIPFALTDSFAIFAVYYLTRQKTVWKALTGSSFLLILCLASYQPEIPLIAFLLLVHCILLILRSQNGSKAFPIRQISVATGALVLATVGYYISVKLTTPLGVGYRSHMTNVNSLPEILQQVQGAYPAFVKYFTIKSDYLPASLRWLPLTVVLAGSVSLVLASWRKGILSVIAVVLMLCLMPIALRATYIINSQTIENLGRLVFPYGFALLFFLMILWQRARLKYLSYAITFILIYFSMMIATQETNAAYLKMIFDLNKINRVAARVESVVPDLYAKSRPILVIGFLPMENQKLKLFPNNGNFAHSNSDAFETYRQSEILNFYFGHDVFLRPTEEQCDRVLPSTKGRRPWPAPESVYVVDNVVVVLLEEYKPGVQITRSH